MADYIQMPEDIAKRAEQQEGYIPRLIEFPKADGCTYWIDIRQASVEQLEQACELEQRAALRYIQRYLRTRRTGAAKLAAQHIWRARAIRLESLDRRHVEPTEAMLPFPRMTKDEIEGASDHD